MALPAPCWASTNKPYRDPRHRHRVPSWNNLVTSDQSWLLSSQLRVYAKGAHVHMEAHEAPQRVADDTLHFMAPDNGGCPSLNKGCEFLSAAGSSEAIWCWARVTWGRTCRMGLGVVSLIPPQICSKNFGKCYRLSKLLQKSVKSNVFENYFYQNANINPCFVKADKRKNLF